MVSTNIAYCSVSGPVLNLLLHMGENQNILFLTFFLFTKCVFEQFMIPPKKKNLWLNILQMLRKGLVHRAGIVIAKELG